MENTDNHANQSSQAATLITRALQVQKRSVRAYEIIANTAPAAKERDLLLSIRREERRHYYLLEGIYEELTGQAYNPSRQGLSLPRHYQDMLKTALCDKLAAIDFYEELRGHIDCVRNQLLLELILDEQKEHAKILAVLYDQC